MKNLLNKLFSKPYTCCMELHSQYGCYISISHPSDDSNDGFRKFFQENNFLIAHNMFEEGWEERVKLEEIFKKLILIYEFDKNDENLTIVYKNHSKVFLPNNRHVKIPSRGIFVYDSSKLRVTF